MKKILAIIFLVSGINSLKCVLIKSQKGKVREVIVKNEYILYPSSMKINRCNGNYNNINNPYSRVFVPNAIKILLQKRLI